MSLQISQKFLVALKLGKRPAYAVAWDAGLHPALLSKLVTGAERLKPGGDPRILRVGEVLGLAPEECFEDERLVGGRR